jgi:hypothetical protein
MSDTGNRRFIMLEECRPVNPPPGTRRTTSLAEGDRFTMVPEAKLELHQTTQNSTSGEVIASSNSNRANEGQEIEGLEGLIGCKETPILAELTIPYSYDELTADNQKRLLSAISKLLQLKDEIRIVKRKPG